MKEVSNNRLVRVACIFYRDKVGIKEKIYDELGEEIFLEGEDNIGGYNEESYYEGPGEYHKFFDKVK